MLVSWYIAPDDTPSAVDLAALYNVFDEVHLFPIEKTLAALIRRLVMLPKYSPHVSTRMGSSGEYVLLLAAARTFAPDAIWLDSLYGGAVALRLAGDLLLPIFYRAHNIEFQYMRSQALQALTLRDKLAWTMACRNLKSFETSIQRNSQLVFDISCDDLSYWQSIGISTNIWAPPLITSDSSVRDAPIPYVNRPYDIVFVGNLFAPNNTRGLEWLINGVLPIVRRGRPAITVKVAGSRPNTRLQRLMACNPTIAFLENPSDVSSIWREGRILVNPIITGSGMNVKSAEMLFYDAHLVTTSIGARGFAPDLRVEFHVADTVESFADTILTLIDDNYEITAGRLAARQRLGPLGIDPIIDLMIAHIGGRPRIGNERHDEQN